MTPRAIPTKPSERLLSRVDAVASSQHGIVSQQQLNEIGLDRQFGRRLVERGLWERAWPGVYRTAGSPVTWIQSLAVAVLASRGLASHRSAARLYGLADLGIPGPEPEAGARRVGAAPEFPVEVTVPHASQRSVPHGAVRYRSRTPAGECLVSGLPATTVERTLVDLCTVLDSEQLEETLDRALHRRLVRARELQEYLRALGAGRSNTGVLGQLLEERVGGMAPSESPLEVRAERVLRQFGIPEPVRQYEVRTGVRSYRLDLAWPYSLVCLEVDGRLHAEGRRFDDDRQRQNDLVGAGWRVLRCTARQIDAEPRRLAEQVMAALES